MQSTNEAHVVLKHRFAEFLDEEAQVLPIAA